MYQGVLKDQQRRASRSAARLALDNPLSSTPNALNTLPPSTPAISVLDSLPASIRGFDAPSDREVKEREERRKERESRQRDFEKSRERDERLRREQGGVAMGGEGEAV